MDCDHLYTRHRCGLRTCNVSRRRIVSKAISTLVRKLQTQQNISLATEVVVFGRVTGAPCFIVPAVWA